MQQLLETRDIMFPVYKQSVRGIGGKIDAPDVKMLTRRNSQGMEEYISVVNKDYRVVENAEILEPLQKQMINFIKILLLMQKIPQLLIKHKLYIINLFKILKKEKRVLQKWHLHFNKGLLNLQPEV